MYPYFEVGDKVKLKSGDGPQMTVEVNIRGIVPGPGLRIKFGFAGEVLCSWKEDGRVFEKKFDQDLLERVYS